MTDALADTLSERLRRISTELRSIDLELKSGTAPEAPLLQEFRYVLDNARLTAWTVSELLNARERNQNPAGVMSFLVAERLRRSTQMLKDLSADVGQKEVTWQTSGVSALFESVNALQVQLSQLVQEHRGRFEKVSEAGR
jgi:hypothetical protein